MRPPSRLMALAELSPMYPKCLPLLLGLALLVGCGTAEEPLGSSAGEIWRAWGMSLPAAPSPPPGARAPRLFLTSEGLSLVGATGQVFTVERDAPVDGLLPALARLQAEGMTDPVLVHADPGRLFRDVWAVLASLGSEGRIAMAVAGPEGEVGAIEVGVGDISSRRHLRLRVQPEGLQIGLGGPPASGGSFLAALVSDDGTCPSFPWADRERQPYEELMRSAGTVTHRNGLTQVVLEAPETMSWGRVAEVGAWLRYRILPGGSRLGLALGAPDWDCTDLPRVQEPQDLVF